MGKQKKIPYIARTADKHLLYEEAVQSVEPEAVFLRRIFKSLCNREARLLKEDFCGTAALACEWVRRRPAFSAIGVDIDKPTLEWAVAHNLAKLPPVARERITLHEEDVRTITTPKVDIVAALNYSYYIFKTRDLLKGYFKAARQSLKKDGMLVLDAYGGSQAVMEIEEKRRCKGFTYVWEQAFYDPITADTLCHIHFNFRDNTRMRKAFTYDWRLWTIPELCELLNEAGFKRVEIYWEGTNEKTGTGNGVYRKRIKGEAIDSWICYLVALH